MCPISMDSTLKSVKGLCNYYTQTPLFSHTCFKNTHIQSVLTDFENNPSEQNLSGCQRINPSAQQMACVGLFMKTCYLNDSALLKYRILETDTNRVASVNIASANELSHCALPSSAAHHVLNKNIPNVIFMQNPPKQTVL